MNKRDVQKLEAAQMRFPRPLLGLARLDRQGNRDIRNRLAVNSLTEDMKLYKNTWLDHFERMVISRLSKLVHFQCQPRGRRDARRPRSKWKVQGHLEL
jgi:hypothetical protein